ncbi:replication protein A 14 kDa subunit [Hydra vulgaris]|uniref:replication protein A 14 kDa subunit n=1 Tax=Hydra vulgaris TaxID=6087 RepID=UPI0001923CD2|nr:replication protein A 14 kDa subunit [Hydra vulgaris]
MEAKQYVNGAMLSSNIGRSVCAIGKVTSMNPNGMGFQIMLADGKIVKVQLEEQLDEPLEGYVQLIARVNRDTSLTAQNLVSFGSGEIDLEIFNKTLNTMTTYPEFFSNVPGVA